MICLPQELSPSSIPRTGVGAQPSMNSIVKKNEKEEVDRVVGKGFLNSLEATYPLTLPRTIHSTKQCGMLLLLGQDIRALLMSNQSFYSKGFTI